MNKEILEIDKFNIISDEENYYFFRALNMADNSDIEQETTTSSDGKIERIRTDRERYEGNAKYMLQELYSKIEKTVEELPEEYRRLIEMIRKYGIGIKTSKLTQAKNQRDSAKEKNEQSKELEKRVSEQLKKRGQAYEEQ